MMKTANIRHKDSLFVTIFNDEAKLLELYNAISGSNYTKDAKIRINTLDSVLFLDKINDISFTIDNKIVILIEHQSTINDNMPLRLLLYISKVYERLIEGRAVYKRKLIKIPTPEFIVLYNGTENYPDEKILKLSDAFETGLPQINLELTVKVIK